MESKHKVFNLIILDASRSMSSIKHTIISGFNEVVQTVKGVALQFPEQEHLISLVSFNSLAIKTLLDNKNVTELEFIDDSKYKLNSGTPLFDAIGDSISKLRRVTRTHTNYNVLVTILTDGGENVSQSYNGLEIKKMIDELKLQNWTFTYIGANHNVEKFAMSISITNTMKFEANERDINRMFDKEKSSRMGYSQKIRDKKDTMDHFYKDEPNETK